MFDTFRSAVPILVLVFVIATMLHVGLTQSPARILKYFKNWPFVLKMMVANFIAAPALRYVYSRATTRRAS